MMAGQTQMEVGAMDTGVGMVEAEMGMGIGMGMGMGGGMMEGVVME